MPAPSDLAVIVCSRERADMLEHALASIVAATPREVEILVVDSASTTTATKEVAEAAGVRYVRSDVKGLSIARNLGLDRPDARSCCTPMTTAGLSKAGSHRSSRTSTTRRSER